MCEEDREERKKTKRKVRVLDLGYGGRQELTRHF